MALSRLGLSPELFVTAFPFHVAFDRDMRIVQAGGVIRRLCPKLSPGSPLHQRFKISRPHVQFTFEAIRKQSQSLFILESRDSSLILKGQMMPDDRQGVMFFLCSPWLTKLAAAEALELSLDDFAIHDPVADFLFLLQSKDSALSDLNRLAMKLQEQRADLQKARSELEIRVQERTRELTAANEKLESEAVERRAAEEALYLQTAALTASANAIVITDQNGNITWTNPAFSTLTGYSSEEVRGKTPRLLKSGRHDGAFYQNLWCKILAGEVWKGEIVNRRKDGSLYTEEQTITPVTDERGAITHFVAIKQDISKRKRAEEELRERARRDPLTGLLNHGAIVESLRGVTAESGARVSHTIAMIDVDGLKAVNDTYGHLVGDDVLKAMAGALDHDGVIAGRFGGDEFVVILPGTDRTVGEAYRADVLERLTETRVTDPETGARVSISASIGVAVYPEDAETIEDLIRIADSAMYAARRQRPIGSDSLSPSRTLGGDPAAEMIGQIVPLLTSQGKLEDKLRLVAHRMSVGGGYDAVNIDVFAYASGLPTARSTFSRVPDDVEAGWQAARRWMEDEPMLQVIRTTRRALIVEDPQHDERLTDAQRGVLRAAELRSAIVLPLIWNDEMIGVISVASKREAAFTARDIEFLTAVAAQVTSVVRMATLVAELQSTSEHLAHVQEEAVLLLAAAAEAHDHTTGLHLRGVRTIVEALARELDYGEEDARQLGLAAVLHDIGKIRVPDLILSSTGELGGEEWEMLRRHTVWGEEFLAGRSGFELAAKVARSHHERWDGTGYPDGLVADKIPLAASIVAVADAFDAMTHDRPYRQRQPVDRAVKEITAFSGTQFNPKVVSALLDLYQRNGPSLRVSGAPEERAAA